MRLVELWIEGARKTAFDVSFFFPPLRPEHGNSMLEETARQENCGFDLSSLSIEVVGK